MSYYYAVHKGNKPGIYYNWNDCLNYIKGYPNSVYKKFNDREHAEYFVKYGKMPSLDQELIQKEGHVSIFTDGSTIRSNNSQSVRYGYGVYIPEYNIEISKELIDENPTNNRCELTAILVGLHTIVNEHNTIKNIHIYTDSQYSITMLSKTQYNDTTINKDLLDKIQILIKENSLIVEYHKVEAHTGYTDNISIANSIVDKLAYLGAKKIEDFSGNIEDYKLTFGKYTGFALKNIPSEYLGWLVKQRKQTWVTRNIEIDIKSVIEYFKRGNSN